LAAWLRQPVLLLVAAGAAYRVFTRDIPASPSRKVATYYLFLLAALGYLGQLAPFTSPARQ
jgi:hypothetical protein